MLLNVVALKIDLNINHLKMCIFFQLKILLKDVFKPNKTNLIFTRKKILCISKYIVFFGI